MIPVILPLVYGSYTRSNRYARSFDSLVTWAAVDCVPSDDCVSSQTFDGGNKWSVRTFGNLDEEEEINYRFQKVRARAEQHLSLVDRAPIVNGSWSTDSLYIGSTAPRSRSLCVALNV